MGVMYSIQIQDSDRANHRVVVASVLVTNSWVWSAAGKRSVAIIAVSWDPESAVRKQVKIVHDTITIDISECISIEEPTQIDLKVQQVNETISIKITGAVC